MPSSDAHADAEPRGTSSLRTTRWSVVLAGARAAPAERRLALEELARLYWYPLYAYARRRGHRSDEAADLTQGFFAQWLERNDVARADPARGRFRAYLRTSFEHFLANEHARRRAWKRGGGRAPLSLDAAAAETRFGGEPVEPDTPERAYERAWVRELLARALDALAAEQERIGRGALFRHLRPSLSAEDDAPRFAQVAAAVGMSENAVKVAAHRLRRRFGELLRAEVAETLADPSAVEEELRSLLGGA